MNPPVLPICSVCARRDAPTYFRVASVSPGGVESPLTTTCSIKCLFQWAYQYAALKGMVLAGQTKSLVQQFVDGIRRMR